jgi:peptidoglycan/LPS O-acetylase OafA/YrhL
MALADLLVFPHFYFILGGIISFSLGLILVLIHKPKFWYSLHLMFMILGMILSVIGITNLMGLTLITHAYLGLAAVVLLVIVIIIGILARFYAKKKIVSRKLHIWTGRISYFLLLITIVLGILFFI